LDVCLEPCPLGPGHRVVADEPADQPGGAELEAGRPVQTGAGPDRQLQAAAPEVDPEKGTARAPLKAPTKARAPPKAPTKSHDQAEGGASQVENRNSHVPKVPVAGERRPQLS